MKISQYNLFKIPIGYAKEDWLKYIDDLYKQLGGPKLKVNYSRYLETLMRIGQVYRIFRLDIKNEEEIEKFVYSEIKRDWILKQHEKKLVR